jgi:glycosyltransferase involved in cell wall biosynthesis
VTATGLRLASATLPYAPATKSVTVIPYGVDTDTFRPAHEREPGADVVIGSVGRLSIEKGLDDLLRAAATLIHRGTRLRVLLAGDGGERRKLEKLARELEIASLVEFRGEIAHAQVPQVLNELDVFVMPSRAEGFGVAALEAAATGLPVVATRVHGIPDVVLDGKTGVLVAPGSVSELAEAIRTLVNDSAVRGEMGHAGRMFVQDRYSWRDNCAQMDALYRRLLAPFTDRRAYGTVATT